MIIWKTNFSNARALLPLPLPPATRCSSSPRSRCRTDGCSHRTRRNKFINRETAILPTQEQGKINIRKDNRSRISRIIRIISHSIVPLRRVVSKSTKKARSRIRAIPWTLATLPTAAHSIRSPGYLSPDNDETRRTKEGRVAIARNQRREHGLQPIYLSALGMYSTRWLASCRPSPLNQI